MKSLQMERPGATMELGRTLTRQTQVASLITLEEFLTVCGDARAFPTAPAYSWERVLMMMNYGHCGGLGARTATS